MAIFIRIIKLFKPLRSPKYDLIQEQKCVQCGKEEYDTHRRASHYDLRSLIFGLVVGTLISLFFAGVTSQWYLSRIQYKVNAGIYPADDTFGTIQTTEVIFEPDPAFIESDPLEGRWDGGPVVLNGDKRTPWDDLYMSPWVEIPDPSVAGASGGVPLKRFSEDAAWSSSSQGFVPSILHQLHCVGILKHALMRFENGDFTYDPFEDTTHCLEYLRQTLMCHGDLTLEKPRFVSEKTFGGPTGWGTAHQCRDWDTIHTFISKHIITFSEGAPIHWVPED